MKAPSGALEIHSSKGNVIISGEDNVLRYRALVLRSALNLEVMGMQHSRVSAYSIVKREYGFKGNKVKVLAQLDAWLDSNIHVQEAAQ